MAKSEKKEKKKFSIDSLEDYIDNLSKKLDKKIDHKKLEEDKNKIYWKGTRYYTESFKENVSTYALIIGAILLVLAIIIGTFVIFGTKKENEGNALNKGEYSIKIHIDFTENFIFSRYDVRLSLGERTTTLSHGESKDVEFYLDKGTYTLSFINMDDTSIRHEEEIEINSNMEIGYKISCHSDKINVEKLYVDKDEEIDSDKIKIDFDKSKFTSKNYKDVVNELKKMGFTNIVEKPLYDIVLGWTEEGEIESVTINGNSDYKRGNVFSKDSEIVVSYHLKTENDPSRIKPPYDCDSIKGINYKEAESAFKNAGFKNIKLIKETTTDNSKNETAYLVRVGLTWADKSLSYDPNTEVEIYYYVYEKKESEPRPGDVRLTHYGAKKAFEKYGQAIYKYGFECHWVLNLIEAEDREDGSIYYKVGVTITNQYNASYDAVAEGIVSGTDNNPKITNFNVK